MYSISRAKYFCQYSSGIDTAVRNTTTSYSYIFKEH